MLPLSQSHLTLFEACPRRYQYVFFDARSAPSTYEQHTQTQWGNQFHLLMQQRALDLPIQTISSADANMAASLDALAKAAPEVFEHLPTTLQSLQSTNSFSQSEHRRMLSFNNYLLTVVYDLVVLRPTQSADKNPIKGHIFDWKTHQTPPPRAKLKADWQTRLYQYVLCETTELAPEQIAMTYWFVRLNAPELNAPELNALENSASLDQPMTAEPSAYQFGYSLAEHDRTRRDLLTLTDALTRMQRAETFPKVDIAKGLCGYCPFAVRCDRLPQSAAHLQFTQPQNTQPQTTQPQNTQPQTTQQLLKAASQLTADSVAEIPL